MINKEYIAKVTTKGQFTLPKNIRDLLHIGTGDYIIIRPKEHKCEIEKAVIRSTEDTFDELSRKVEARFKDNGITKDDVEDAITCAKFQS